MKRFYQNAGMAFFFLFSAITVTKAQIDPFKICFTDNYGYLWKFSLTNDGSDPAFYTGQGTCSIGDGEVWFAYGTGFFPNGPLTTGSINLRAVNPYPNQCRSYSDSFSYTGTGVGALTAAGITKWSGSGSWLSYCHGGVTATDLWSASGSKKDCSLLSAQPQKSSNAAPAKGNTVSTKIQLKATPNPMVNSTSIEYILSIKTKVNIIIYNMMNQPVIVLVNAVQAAGKYSVNWNGLDATGLLAPNGIYKVVSTADGVKSSTTLQIVR